MACDRRKSFTLIELLVVMAVISILSVSGAYLMASFVQNFVFIPAELNVERCGKNILDAMIDGDTNARGLRYSRLLYAANADSVTFKNTDGRNVSLRWDAATQKIYRAINGGLETTLPDYFPQGYSVVQIVPRPILRYYDGSEVPTALAAQARRVEISFRVMSTTGNETSWDGTCDFLSSVAVDKYE